MGATERKIPNFVFEDLLFRRRLERTLNAELEKTNALLAVQARLLQERRALMAEVHDCVQQRWKDEDAASSDTPSEPNTKEVGYGD
jgi:hypothetical protein